MKEISSTLNIYLCFILIIIVITIIYISQNKNKSENFDSMPNLTNTITTQPNITLPIINNATPTNANIDADITTDDTTIRDIVIQSLKDLQTGLLRFSNLDAPMTINDDGNTCSVWGQYSNGKYSVNDNNCIIADNTNIRKCLGANGGLSTCDNLYSDGYINKMNNININPFVKQSKKEILDNVKIAKVEWDNKSNKIDCLINDLVSKRNLENQQLYFINYNTNNLQDKEKNINKIDKEVSIKQTDVNINQLSFSNFIANNTSKDNLNNIYYKIIIGLVIIIVIIGILNYLFSNVL